MPVIYVFQSLVQVGVSSTKRMLQQLTPTFETFTICLPFPATVRKFVACLQLCSLTLFQK
jgi:hypothetical protein